MKLIDNAWLEFKRLWSIRLALVFAALNGFMIGFVAFVNVVKPMFFLVVNVIGWTVLIAARLLKQPGAHPDQAGVDEAK